MLSDRMRAYAPEDDKRDEVLVQLFTLRKWGAEVADLEVQVARLREALGTTRTVAEFALQVWEHWVVDELQGTARFDERMALIHEKWDLLDA